MRQQTVLCSPPKKTPQKTGVMKHYFVPCNLSIYHQADISMGNTDIVSTKQDDGLSHAIHFFPLYISNV